LAFTATLPTWARPHRTRYRLQQGTTKRSWLYTAYTNGNSQLMRYGISGWETVSVDHWLPLDASWTVNYSAGI